MMVDHPFEIGDKVSCDGDDSAMVVIGLWYRAGGTLVHCSYFANGDLKEPWIESWRLKPWEKR